MRFLLLLAILMGAVWLLRRFLRQLLAARAAQRLNNTAHNNIHANTAESMVVCTYCKVHQPISESLLQQGQYYCCAAHAKAQAARQSKAPNAP